MTVSIMNRLTRALFETLEEPVFTAADIQNIEPNDNARYALVKRALRNGDLIQIRRGLYTFCPTLRKKSLHPGALANRLYYPSYVSMEYALGYHGWIPEAVVKVTCATSRNSTDFDTKVGLFSYHRIPQAMFFCGVDAVSTADRSWLLASPLKALADYVYARKLRWPGIEPLLESLRIEEEALGTLSAPDFESVQGNYRTAPDVEKFLSGLREDLHV